MVEKYDQPKSHPEKFKRYALFATAEQRRELKRISEEETKHDGRRVQLPDLFVMSQDESSFWFVEVKGHREPLLPTQTRSHDRIRTRLGLRVDVIRVHPIDLDS